LKEKIFQAVLVLVLLVVTGFTGCTTAQEEALPSEPSMPPEFFLDSDGDGFNDWFETNIAGYDPNVPNNRYVISYVRFVDPTKSPDAVLNVEDALNPTYQFFTEKGKVPPENIIGLYEEEASDESFRDAIYQVAEKSNENDIVFLSIQCHGHFLSRLLDPTRGDDTLDEWLDKINAKVVVVTIMACGCEFALPQLKDGLCPRIVFIYSAREFIGALGENPAYAIAADTKYGNGDGYVSVGEISNWIDNDPMWGPDWGELYEKGRSYLEAKGYSKMSDTSNIAQQIYLTDYTPTLDKAP